MGMAKIVKIEIRKSKKEFIEGGKNTKKSEGKLTGKFQRSPRVTALAHSLRPRHAEGQVF